MQARRVPDGDARAMLRQAAERVEAVTLVHRRLYTGDDVAFVEMDAYLAGLIDELRRAIPGKEASHVAMSLACDPVRVETDRAVSIGLIVNELVTNAIKYAYPENAEAAIRVSLLRQEGAARLRLVVEDDGVGYPEQGAKPRGSGMGSMIVKSMAQSLQAVVELDPAHAGTRFVITLDA
jgi:two-component sensor histidine kinase